MQPVIGQRISVNLIFRKKRRRRKRAFFLFLVLWGFASIGMGEVQVSGPLERVPAVSIRKEWNRFKILVWSYQTDVLRDFGLYRQLGLEGFHVDRGAGEGEKVAFSVANRFPYYVDHAADKGFLYLTGDNVKAVMGKRGLVSRPRSLADPAVLEAMKGHIQKNVTETARGLVLAYAFDDEISLGRISSPCDVDGSSFSLRWFQQWLRAEYGAIAALNRQWGSQFRDFNEVSPAGFETVRKLLKTDSMEGWNLSPWLDFRSFMDYQFAAVLSELTRFTNRIDPKTPAGFVGGQGPGPWGGYNYALLSRAVQWMEAYDIHGTNEILRSWWNEDRRPRMQTFFSTKNPKIDSWVLWYYLLHGHQAVIAWPEGWFHTHGQEIAPHIQKLKEMFTEIQGPVSEVLVDPVTRFDPDPIGIYYSHPSIQAGWAMDALTHGKTWINRLGSVDDKNQSMGVLRNAWCKILEDLGYQYDFVSYLDVEEGAIRLSGRFRVIILPKTLCLSEKEAAALRKYVVEGGTLVADSMCGLLDAHGRARPDGVLDKVFGIKRDPSAGYMNGKGLTEIDAEKYEKPFLERFSFYEGAYRYKGLPVMERGTKQDTGAEGRNIYGESGQEHRTSVLISNPQGKGRAIYLNLSPLAYWDAKNRWGSFGTEWRNQIGSVLKSAGLAPRVQIYEHGNSAPMIEALFWKNGDKRILGIVKNPSDHKEMARVGEDGKIEGISGNPQSIELAFKEMVTLFDLRQNRDYGSGSRFMVPFTPWEGHLYAVGRAR
ncbi:MAG: alpha-amylase family protein [Pseudomonadota bacterium]